MYKRQDYAFALVRLADLRVAGLFAGSGAIEDDGHHNKGHTDGKKSKICLLYTSTTPVKLPAKRCPSREVRPQTTEGWYFTLSLIHIYLRPVLL